LFPALGLIPVWSIYMLNGLAPLARHEHYGFMLLAFGAVGLAAGRWLKRRSPQPDASDVYALPAYMVAYVTLIVGTLLVAHDQALLALALLYDALLMIASASLFKNAFWAYPAATLGALSYVLAVRLAGIQANRQGWWLIGLAGVYLLIGWRLRRANLAPFGAAAIIVGFGLIAFSLPPSSQDEVGALWGYGGAALLYAITAIWLCQPLLLVPACLLASVPYAVGLRESALGSEYYGLALLPGSIAALAAGTWMDSRFGTRRDFPWGEPARWVGALSERLLSWYGLALYALGFSLAAVSPLLAGGKPGLIALDCLLTVPLSCWAIYRFRLRVWLFAATLAGQLAWLYYLRELGWGAFSAETAIRFLPMTVLTILLGVVVQLRLKESSPLTRSRPIGWSHVLYLFAAVDISITQVASLSSAPAGGTVSLTNALLLAILASIWLSKELPYVSAAIGAVSLLQLLVKQPVQSLPVAFAQLALGYGLVGYGLAFIRARGGLPSWLRIWENSLQQFAAWLSFAILAVSAALGIDLVGWTVRALFGFPFREIVDIETAQMTVGVLSLLGLLYIAAAFSYRKLRLGYVAIGMLLVAWMVHAFYVQQWDGESRVQWYAIPAGLYLLGIAYLEWERGNKSFARWLDYAAVLLMMGSLFWQTLLLGWEYAVMLGAEGFAGLWWGSARRLRRFLYAGMLGVILATVAQLLNSLQSINQWIVFGVIGLLVVVAAILIERKIEDIKAWRQVFETWE
jgi:hypothetical protein